MQARMGAVDPFRHAKLTPGFRSVAVVIFTIVSVAALEGPADLAAGNFSA